MTTDYQDSRYSWFRLAVSLFAATVGGIGMWAIVLVLPEVQADFGIERSQASIAYIFTMIGFGMGTVLLGYVVDRFGIAPIVAGAAVIAGVSYYFSSLVSNVWLFAALQVPVGVAAAAGFGPMIADISHWFSRYRGIAVAVTACGNYLSGTVWPLILKQVIAEHGWRGAFIWVAIGCVVLLLPAAAILRKRLPAEHFANEAAKPAKALKTIRLTPRQLQLLLAAAGVACCVGMSMPQVHIVAYAVDLGYGLETGAQLLAVMLGAGVISRLFFGFFADRFGGIAALLTSSTLQYLALAFYTPFTGLNALYAVTLFFGLAQGGIVPSYAIIIREYLPAAEAGRRIGLVFAATIVGMALGGWLSGLLLDLTGSYFWAIVNGVAWNFLNIAIMVFVLSKTLAPRALPATAPSGA